MSSERTTYLRKTRDFLSAFAIFFPIPDMFERKLRDMEWTLPSPKWIFVFNILLFLLRVSLAKTLATIHWDKNANFGTDGLLVQAEIDDRMKIECPKTPNTTTGRQYAQYLTFTQVSQQGFETCSLENANARLLLMCNRPFEDNSYILLFQLDSPFPGGLTFRHSETYYFITTSDGTLEGLHRSENGLCETHNMKIMVYIKPKPTEAIPTDITTARMRPSSRPPVRTTRPTTLPTTHRRTTTLPQPETQQPDVFTDKPVGKTPKKKNPDPQSGDNAGTALRHSPLLLFVSCCLAVLRWSTTT